MRNSTQIFKIMRNDLRTWFCFRATSATKGVIEVTYVINKRKGTPLSTGIRVSKEVWKYRKSKDTPKRYECDIEKLNKDLILAEEQIKNCFTELSLGNRDVTRNELHDRVFGIKKDLPYTLVELAERYLKERKLQIVESSDDEESKGLSKSTYISYEQSWNRTKKVLTKLRVLDTPVRNVDINFLKILQKEFVNLGFSNGTISNSIVVIKQIIAFGIELGVLESSSVFFFRAKKSPVQKPVCLHDTMIAQLENFEGYDEEEKKIVMAWLFARELSVHWIDYCTLKNTYFKDIEGYKIFERLRRKNKKPVVSVLSQRALRCLEFFGNDAESMPFQIKYAKVYSKENLNALFSNRLRKAVKKVFPDLRLVFSNGRDSRIYEVIQEKRTDHELKAMNGWVGTSVLSKYYQPDPHIVITWEQQRQNTL